MINKLIALTLLVFSSILSFGQIEKVISVRGGNGTLYEAKGLVDDSGYSVLIFQFVPKSSIFVLLDQDQNEISRYEVGATKLVIKGYSATSKEFIVHFDGKINSAKTQSYFVAFFKDGRTPVFSEWLDIPTSIDKLFSYSYDDKFFVGTTERKSSLLKIFEVSTINSIKEISFKLSDNVLNKLKEGLVQNASWGDLVKFGVNTINPNQDSLRIFFLRDEQNSKEQSLQILTLNLKSNSVAEKSFLTQQFNSPSLCIVNDLLFVADRGRTFNPNSSLTIASLKSLKILKSYRFEPDILANETKFGPLVELKTGKIWQEGGSEGIFKKFVQEVGGFDIIGANETNGKIKLRLGGTKIISVYSPPGSGPIQSTYIPLIFSIGLDKDLNILWEPQKDNYFEVLKNYQDNVAKKTLFINQKVDRQLNFINNSDLIISFYYSDKTNQVFISKMDRQ